MRGRLPSDMTPEERKQAMNMFFLIKEAGIDDIPHSLGLPSPPETPLFIHSKLNLLREKIGQKISEGPP